MSHTTELRKGLKIFRIIMRDQCVLTVLQFLPNYRPSIVTPTLLGLLFELSVKLLCFCCTNINRMGDHKSVNLINKSTAVKPACKLNLTACYCLKATIRLSCIYFAHLFYLIILYQFQIWDTWREAIRFCFFPFVSEGRRGANNYINIFSVVTLNF